MHRKARYISQAAIIAALYATLTHMQNLLLPNSASMAVQFRLSEALCVLSLFTPAAVPGLTLGCLVFNLTFAGALPLDWVLGSLATLLAARGMWRTRHVTVGGFPLPAMAMSALWNALLVGGELTVYIGGSWWVNGAYVAAGELAVTFTLGTTLYRLIRGRRLDVLLFGNPPEGEAR